MQQVLVFLFTSSLPFSGKIAIQAFVKHFRVQWSGGSLKKLLFFGGRWWELVGSHAENPTVVQYSTAQVAMRSGSANLCAGQPLKPQV